MQNSLLPGRGTLDNAFLAHEINHHMDKSGRRHKNLAFNIDLEKETIEMFGFPEALVNLIMCCVTSSNLTLLWNGTKLPSICLGRGLCQGDPLSPYLFVLCMERLSVRIQTLVDEGSWHPIMVSPDGPPISHLFFC